MMRRYPWTIVLVIGVVLFLVACADAPVAGTGEGEPAIVEPIEGTDFNRVTLTEHAAQRLGIQTAVVTEEAISRALTTNGLVEDSQAAAGGTEAVRVRVSLTQDDLMKVAAQQPARVMTFGDDEDDDDDEDGLEAEAIEVDDLDDLADSGDQEDSLLYYEVSSANHNLKPGQDVRVKLSTIDSGSMKKIIPYSALLYDLEGNTWIYTSPDHLVFVRHPVTVDYIEGDRVILSDGPAAGTVVATVGVAELYGADTGVGK